MRALILSGAGRYADPWHPFPETSARIGATLSDAGFDVEVSEAVDARLAALAHPFDGPDGLDADPDLLVLNIGDPSLKGASDPEAEALGRVGLLTYLARGRALLASHVSSTSLRGVPEWEDILGAVWVRGVTFHPDYGRAHIRVRPERHVVVAGLDDFEVEDERYTDLRVADDVVPLATHEHEGNEHPVMWARMSGSSRVFYDALGHDTASYESVVHREILRRAALWLTAEARR